MSVVITTTTTLHSTSGAPDSSVWGTTEHVVVLEEHQDEPLTLGELEELVTACRKLSIPPDTQTSLYGGVEVKHSWRSR